MRTIQRATFWLLSMLGLVRAKQSADEAVTEELLDEVYSYLPECYDYSVDKIEAMLDELARENDAKQIEVEDAIEHVRVQLAETTALVADLGTGAEYRPVAVH
ncbi:MAG: hypothetical protein OXG15_01450, partial [Gammaproteobacteria bacterium]|nr:hypothetical protein [Gammaproteobacteria bacterium]